MPIVIAASVKSALLVGAAIGLTAAVISNDRVLEIAADTLQRGADYLNDRLKNKRFKAAAFVPMSANRQPPDYGTESGATTPSATDDEFSGSDKEEEAQERFSSFTSGYEKSSGASTDTLSIHSLD